MAVQQIVQDKGMFARVLFIVTQSHPTVSAISSWNKTGDEQIMSNNWRYILYYSHKITFPPKVWGWRRQAREQVHEHYSFLPYFGTTAQKNPKHKYEFLIPEILGYPIFFTGGSAMSIVTECLKNCSSETFWLCRRNYKNTGYMQ